MKCTTSCRHRSTCSRSAPTCDTPSVARCQRSWSSHSAIDTLNLFCTRALIIRSTLRLPLSEWFSGSKSSSRSTPTTMARPPGTSGSRRCRRLALARCRREAPRHLLDLVRLDDVADLHVLEALERVPYIVHRLVDHRVEADVHAFAFGQRCCLRFRANVEADDDRVRRGGEQHVGLGDAAD